ncbi:hypothetical protein V4F39_25065 [Aquincola sp. MAHUQ-54]|uniref:Uncharacterized protein n=1 Tax=Aquincola agrisoli TaxID=3119538 RepID=A0AAW9QP95_9BURK
MKKNDPIACAVAALGTLVLGVALAGVYRAVEAPSAPAAAPLAAPAPAATVPLSSQQAGPAPAPPRG